MLTGIKTYLAAVAELDRNLRRYWTTVFLANMAFGVFLAEFNLYILSLGIKADFLGVILSLTPFAQGIASIPMGYIAEKIGNKRALIMINSLVGLAYLLRVISPSRPLIMLGSFLAGVMACGYFIIQMPLISHYVKKNKNNAFTFHSIVFFAGQSSGALLGGLLPGILGGLIGSEVLVYRTILVFFALLIILSTLPLLRLQEDKPQDTSNVSFSPYLQGIDGNTVRFAIIEFFIGVGMMSLVYFMNILFVRSYNSTLSAYGITASLVFIPATIILFWAPTLARKKSTLWTVMASRLVGTLLGGVIAVTVNPLVGAVSFILFRASLSISQSLWLSFASAVATRRSRVATSAWLEATFDIGTGIAALIGGVLIQARAYYGIGLMSAIGMGLTYVLTWLFFARKKDIQAIDAEMSV